MSNNVRYLRGTPGGGGSNLESGGEPPNEDGMEKRVGELEKTMGDVRERLARIETKVDGIDKHGANKADLKSLESMMIRWFVATAIALSAAAFAIARFVQ